MFNQVVDRVLQCSWLQLIQVVNHHHFRLVEIVGDEIWHIGLRIRFDLPILPFLGFFYSLNARNSGIFEVLFCGSVAVNRKTRSGKYFRLLAIVKPFAMPTT